MKKTIKLLLPKFLVTSFINVKKKLIIFMYYLFRVFPLDSNKIMIVNYYGKGFGDNAKYIVEEIKRRKIKCKIIWQVNKNIKSSFPNYVKTVKYRSLIAIYHEVTAGIWIDNCRKHSLVRKRQNQLYIQTWHGGIGLKKIEKDVETKLSLDYVNSAKNDSKIADYIVSNSAFNTKIIKTSFWYSGEIIEVGYPRNDILIKNPISVKNKVLNIYKVASQVKTILYAPTFRADFSLDVYNLDFKNITNSLEKAYNCNFTFLVRLHPNISNLAKGLEYSEKVINCSDYADMQELMVATDILITDYSSTMFEFMLMKKPVFLFATDLIDYKADRDLNFDFFSLPFPAAENNTMLLNNMLNFNYEQYLLNVSRFYHDYGLNENGDASSRIADIIEKQINNKLLNN